MRVMKFGLGKGLIKLVKRFIKNDPFIEGNMDFTAIIRKGEKQYVALCPEVDVASQSLTVEEALENLKEAVELYIEEMGMPKEFEGKEAIITRFAVTSHAQA